MDYFSELRTIIIGLSPSDELDQRKMIKLLWQATTSERQSEKVCIIADELEELILPLAIAAAVGNAKTLAARKKRALSLLNDLQIACSFKIVASLT